MVVYDLDAAAMKAITGASAATDVQSLAGQAEITLLSLPTPEVVNAVADAWALRRQPGSILVDLSTNSPAEVRALGSPAGQFGSSPGRGTPDRRGHRGRDAGCSCSWSVVRTMPVGRVMPVLEPLGRATFHVGALGLGNTMKLLNSLIAFTTTWVSLEGLSFATKAGIDVQDAVEILRTAGASNFFIDRQVETIDGRGRPTQFALALAAKDAGLIVDSGEALGVPTPVAPRSAACSTRRSSKVWVTPTGVSSSPSPSSRATSPCAGTLRPARAEAATLSGPVGCRSARR